MTGSPAGGAPAPVPKQRVTLASLITRTNIAIASAALVLVVLIVAAMRYRSGSNRRQYESVLAASLDRIVTAQEGFYYDSTKYVASLQSLPTVHLPPGVRVMLYSPDRRSWWGVATHDRLPAHHCVVWVGKPPTSIPAEARAPENETKPLCFEDNVSVAKRAQRS